MTEPATTRYRVGGMDCAACAAKIETAVGRLPGVSTVGVSVAGGTLRVAHAGPGDAAIRQAVTRLGYTIAPADSMQPAAAAEHHPEPGEAPWWTSRKAQLTLAAALAVVAAYGLGLAIPAIAQWAFLAALLVGLVPIAWRAARAALAGTPFSIETLMTIAAVGAVIIGATEEAAMVVVLFLIGELLEGIAGARARASIRGLSAMVPKTAWLEAPGDSREVPAATLQIGDTIMVRPGDRIPADGDIVAGSSGIDESPVSGESLPQPKAVGDAVFAGTINGDAVLRIRVTAAAADNTIARVVRLVEEAQEHKAPTERFIDRFSKVYTPAVLVVGALVAVVPPLLFGAAWGEWIYKGLAVLLIGCPCALVISTPAAIAAGLAAGARHGLLLKGGVVLERLRTITTIAFDKTGTLTEGRPVVTDVESFGRSEQQVLALAASLEAGSSHPLATAILVRARDQGAPIPPALGAKAVAGKGVSGSIGGAEVFLGSPQAIEEGALTAAQQARIAAFTGAGKSVSVLLVDGAVAGLFAMRDEPRADAQLALQALRDAGVDLVMLTGDNRQTAAAIAGDLGIEARAELLPADKQRLVRELQTKGEIVAKVGDGINDAPALAAADIGIAMGGGTDVALETADAAVLHGRLSGIPDMLVLSGAVMGNITQNITIALGLKGVLLVTTILGITGLWPAILADTGATVLVTANAMRLLGWRGRSASGR